MPIYTEISRAPWVRKRNANECISRVGAAHLFYLFNMKSYKSTQYGNETM